MAEKTNLQKEDFSKWYIQTIQKADFNGLFTSAWMYDFQTRRI